MDRTGSRWNGSPTAPDGCPGRPVLPAGTYVGIESLRALANGEHPDETLVGVLLACGSIAGELGSAATKGEGRQNVLCAYLAGALLIGLLGNAWFGAWWLDPTVGLLIATVAAKEGREAWHGEGCCTAAPASADAVPGLVREDKCCP